jgi:16S rRNA processing protein RimM
VAAVLGAPFGIKGFIKVRSLSGEHEHIIRLKTVLVLRGAEEETLDIEAAGKTASGLVVKFRGIDSPEAAKALGGAKLLVPREAAAPLRAGEYYVEDLKGITVVAEGGEALGVITDVVEGGGGELVELRLPGGALRFIPFRKEFIGDISPENRQAVLLVRWIIE